MGKSYTDNDSLPLSDTSYQSIAIFLTVAILIGTIGNGICLYMFAKYKKLRNAQNIFIIALNMCDMTISLIVSPMATASAYARGWLWGDIGCYFEAYMSYAIGLSSLYLHMFTAMDRSIAITKPAWKSSRKRAVKSCALCYVLGFSWASCPLLGWNDFTLEESRIACSLKWTATDDLSTSYIYVTGVIGFLIPSIVMIIAYASITKKLRRLRSTSAANANETAATRTLAIEKRTIVTGVLIMSSFMFCWLPYAIISFSSAFGYRRQFPMLLVAGVTIFAKCQGTLDAILLFTRHRELRKISSQLGPIKFFMKTVCGMCKNRAHPEVDPSSPFNTQRWLRSTPDLVITPNPDQKQSADTDKPSIHNTAATEARPSTLHLGSD